MLSKAQSTPDNEMDIAIVGMSCRFPGADNYTTFWDNLCGGIDSIAEVPSDRWDWRRYFGDSQTGANRTHSKWGGYIDQPGRFDASFFGISPREALSTDPQQRILLELAWQCFDDAGCVPAQLSGQQVGVYIGACNFDYKTLQEQPGLEVEGHSATGNANTILPNRISYFFNLYGPSIAVDTACSSSLVALSQAVAALRSGECSSALAGGISILTTPDRYISFSKVGMLSPTGTCKTFDASADGYVRGEGGGLVYLKRLSDALAAGDRIHGVIKGVAINHGGRTRSLTAPSALAQSKVVSAALRQSGVDASTIGYVEAHGTGTPLGDPIEIHGLVRAFDKMASQKGATNYCALGAVKTNIGHLEAAAGIAGVIKVLLAMKHKTLPGNLHFSSLNPRIQLEGTPFRILDTTRPWQAFEDETGAPLPLRAGVSSFGFGGVNSHIVLEQAVQAETPAPAAAPSMHLLVLSAFCKSSLRQAARDHAELLRAAPESVARLCRAAAMRRAPMGMRFAAVGASASELLAALDAFGYEDRVVAGACVGEAGKGRVGFLFTGQGSQYLGMGKGLFESQPVYRSALERCDAALRPHLDRSIIELMFGADGSLLDRTRYTQPALFALEFALSELWASFGIRPAALIGHSVGEFAAACVAGVMSLEDAAALIARRGALMDALDSEGSMASVMLGVQEVEQMIRSHGWALDIAAVNGPAATVISGARAELDRALSALSEQGIEAKQLVVSQAFHSRLMEPMLDAFRQTAAGLAFANPSLRLVSNVTGTADGSEVFNADYWVEHVRRPVQFQKGIAALHASGVDVALELGPHAVLGPMARRTLGDAIACVASLREGMDASRQFFAALGELFVKGAALDLAPLFEGGDAGWIDLPPYSFSGQNYWITPAAAPLPAAVGQLDSGDPLLGQRVALAMPGIACYSANCADTRLDYLEQHRVQGNAVMPGTAYLAAAMSAVADAGKGPHVVEKLVLHRPMVLAAGSVLQTIVDKDGNVGFHSCSDLQAGEWVQHASARIVPDLPFTAKSMPAGAPGTMLDVGDMYAAMARRGLEYGAAFRAVEALELRGDVTVASIGAPLESLDGHHVHPALLDAVFHTAFPLLPDEAFVNSMVPLPVAVDAFRLQDSLPARLRVQCSVERQDAANYRCRFELYDGDGRAIGLIEGLALRRMALPRPAVAQASASADTGILFAPAWVPSPLPLDAATNEEGTALIVYPDAAEKLASAIAAALPSQVAIRARIGDHAALASLVRANPGLKSVYFLGGISDPGTTLEASQEHGLEALFHLAKALPQLHSPDLELALKVVTAESCVLGGESLPPFGASCHGLAAVLAAEHSNIRLACIDLDAATLADDGSAARIIVAEPATEAGVLSAWRRGERHLRQVAPVSLPAAEDGFRHGGVYLIVGGAGGIGLVLSRYLASHYLAKLVWTGRSALDDSRRRAMQQVRDEGGEVIYLEADVANESAMREAAQTAITRFGALHGVVHSALQLRDRAFSNMDSSDLAASAAPKIAGSWALAQAVRGHALDWIMFFSSGVSFFPNPGQANYVAGSMFQDAYAAHLAASGVPVRVINWGRWGSVGAATDESVARRLAAHGFLALTPDEGIDTILRVAAGGLGQVIALKATPERLASMGIDGAARTTAQATVARTSAAEVLAFDHGDTQASLGLLQQFLRDELVEVMRLDPAALDGERPLPEMYLSELGVDSLTAMELRNRLRRQFSVDIAVEVLLGGARIRSVLEAIQEQLLVRSLMAGAADNGNDDAMETLVL